MPTKGEIDKESMFRKIIPSAKAAPSSADTGPLPTILSQPAADGQPLFEAAPFALNDVSAPPQEFQPPRQPEFAQGDATDNDTAKNAGDAVAKMPPPVADAPAQTQAEASPQMTAQQPAQPPLQQAPAAPQQAQPPLQQAPAAPQQAQPPLQQAQPPLQQAQPPLQQAPTPQQPAQPPLQQAPAAAQTPPQDATKPFDGPPPYPINLAEYLVDKNYDRFRQKVEGCTCERCRDDVFAITLNKIQPQYVASNHLEAALQNTRELTTEIVTALMNALFIVKRSPRHEESIG